MFMREPIPPKSVLSAEFPRPSLKRFLNFYTKEDIIWVLKGARLKRTC
jgi:hypothetical protein